MLENYDTRFSSSLRPSPPAGGSCGTHLTATSAAPLTAPCGDTPCETRAPYDVEGDRLRRCNCAQESSSRLAVSPYSFLLILTDPLTVHDSLTFCAGSLQISAGGTTLETWKPLDYRTYRAWNEDCSKSSIGRPCLEAHY